ncbi:uncharacterized protein wu:fc50b12 isoform X2 [Engraulis encrasicolus]
MKTIQEVSKQLGFEWIAVAYELGFTREEIGEFRVKGQQNEHNAETMLKCWYERCWDKSNKTKLLQDGLERAGRRDLAEHLRCLHWGHQKLSRKVELPSAFPYIITVHKTRKDKRALGRINDLKGNCN